MGLYVHEGRLWFEVVLKPYAIRANRHDALVIRENSGSPGFPYWWQPSDEHGPWNVIQLMNDGLREVILAIKEHAEISL